MHSLTSLGISWMSLKPSGRLSNQANDSMPMTGDPINPEVVNRALTCLVRSLTWARPLAPTKDLCSPGDQSSRRHE